MESIRIVLPNPEYEALATLAGRELRPLADQARVVLREALRREGLLDDATVSERPLAEVGHVH